MAKKQKPKSLLWKPNPEGPGEYMRYGLGFIFRHNRNKYVVRVGYHRMTFCVKTLANAKLIIDAYTQMVYESEAKHQH